MFYILREINAGNNLSISHDKLYLIHRSYENSFNAWIFVLFNVSDEKLCIVYFFSFQHFYFINHLSFIPCRLIARGISATFSSLLFSSSLFSSLLFSSILFYYILFYSLPLLLFSFLLFSSLLFSSIPFHSILSLTVSQHQFRYWFAAVRQKSFILLTKIPVTLWQQLCHN